MRTLLFLLSFFTGSLSFGQRYNIIQFGTEDGLDHSVINATFQDSRGYMWFGTDGGGLSRYNGREFKTYTEENGLSSNIILAIEEDNSGKLWIGTNGKGVTVYDGEEFVPIEDTLLAGRVIYRILNDEEGNLWFATFGNGLVKYNGEHFSRIGEGIIDPSLFSLAEDSKGRIWTGSNGAGIFIIHGDKITIPDYPGLDSLSVFSLTRADNGNILIGTLEGKIYLWDGAKVNEYAPAAKSDINEIWAVHQDRNGNVWVAAEGQGVFRFNDDRQLRLTEENGLAVNTVYAITEDYTGNIWFGTFGGGVNKFNGEAFVYYTEENGLSSNDVYSVTRDKDGRMWFGTAGAGLNVYDGEQFIEIAGSGLLNKATVYSIFPDSDGRVWIGTEDMGVFLYDQGRISPFDEIDRKEYKTIMAIYEDAAKNIWFGSNGKGVLRYDGKQLKSYTEDDGLCSNRIISITGDRQGNIWFGTLDGGVCRLELPGSYNLWAEDELGSKFVWTITGDQAGAMWVGTVGNGVWKFRNGDPEINYTIENGLSNNNAYTVIFDNSQNLWIGSNKGLDKVSFDQYDSIKSVNHYGKEEGFIGIETNYSNNALYKQQDGLMWFATKNGVTRYDPSKDRPNTRPPLVHITEIKLFREKTAWDNYSDSLSGWAGLPYDLTLDYDQNSLGFEFIGLNMTIPGKIIYQYKLKGLENEWAPAGNKTEASYPSIPPGEYTFMVKAANNEGVWSEPTTFSFKIAPPFWQTGWFYVGMLLLGIFVIAGFIKLRERKLLKEKAVLEEKVEERTRDLAEANNNISLQKEKLEHAYKDITDSVKYAKRIQEAILPPERIVNDVLDDGFILYKPKDIVSGDFYWLEKVNGASLVAAVDCTGHGVPGAFMSIVGHNGLNRAVREKGLEKPSEILDHLNEAVSETLRQQDTSVKDGMDLALCSVNKKEMKLHYAGAYNPLYMIREGELTEIKGNKFPIGAYIDDEPRFFTNHEVDLKPGDTFYFFSDGYADQFGGPKGKKYKYGKLKKLLIAIQDKPMSEQKEILEKEFAEWKGSLEQIDDVCLIGVRI